MKSTIGWLTHVACLASIFMAIWVPFGSRGQWIAMAVVLLLVGAMLLGSAEKTTYARGGETPNSVTYSSDVPEHLRSEDGVEQLRAERRPTYGKRAE